MRHMEPLRASQSVQVKRKTLKASQRRRESVRPLFELSPLEKRIFLSVSAPSNVTYVRPQNLPDPTTAIKLSWQNNSSPATDQTSTLVQRLDPVTGNYVTCTSGTGGTLAGDATTFTDMGLTPSTVYHYRIVANSSTGPSSDDFAAMTGSWVDLYNSDFSVGTTGWSGGTVHHDGGIGWWYGGSGTGSTPGISGSGTVTFTYSLPDHGAGVVSFTMMVLAAWQGNVWTANIDNGLQKFTGTFTNEFTDPSILAERDAAAQYGNDDGQILPSTNWSPSVNDFYPPVPSECHFSIAGSVYGFTLPFHDNGKKTLTVQFQAPGLTTQDVPNPLGSGSPDDYPTWGINNLGVVLQTTLPQPPQSCNCGQGGNDNINANVSGNSASDNSNFSVGSEGDSSDVNPATGDLTLISTDLSSGNDSGFGQSWGWTNGSSLGNAGMNGGGVVDARQSALTQLDTATLVLTNGVNNSSWFDGTDSGGWAERFFGKDVLSHTTDTDSQPIYRLADTLGNISKFYDFSTSWAAALRGKLRSFTDASGNVTTYTYDTTSGLLQSAAQTNGTSTETFGYSYYNGSYNSGMLQQVTLTRSGSVEPVQQVTYSYYDGSGTGGNIGDLASVLVESSGLAGLTAVPTTITSSLPAGVAQFYIVTAVTAAGETDGSAEVTATPASGQGVQLNWTAFPGATSYKVYRNNASGGEVFLASVTSGHAYTDDGTVSLGTATPPAVATSATVYRYWRAGETASVLIGGTPTTTKQPTGFLKYVFGSQSYARAMAAGVNPATASDADVQQYADKGYTYYNDVANDPEHIGWVASETNQGTGTDSFSYSDSTNDPGYNKWARKAVETLPDGSTVTVYSNYASEPMLKVFTSGTQQWGMAYIYDKLGRLVETVHPDALKLPTTLSTVESYPDLLDYHLDTGVSPNRYDYLYMNPTSGLVDVNGYYAVTNATSTQAGGVAGYDFYHLQQQGEFGPTAKAVSAGNVTSTVATTTPPTSTVTIVLTSHGFADGATVYISGAAQPEYNGVYIIHRVDANTFQYTIAGSPATTATGNIWVDNQPYLIEAKDYRVQTADSGHGGATVVWVADDTLYGQNFGGDPRTTVTNNVYFAGTTQLRSQTVTKPVVSAAQNGPGTPDTSTQVFDQYGRTIYTIDGDGHVNQTIYDPATGAATTSSTDVSPYLANVLADNPLGYWRLGEATGTSANDSSGNGHTGTYTGTVSLAQSGALANDSDTSVSFAGAGTVNAGGASSFTFANAQMTVEAWVYLTSGGAYQFIASKSVSTGSSGSYDLTVDPSNAPYFGTWTSTGAMAAQGRPISLNAWHHVVGTCDGTTLAIYVDGVRQGTQALSGTVNTNSSAPLWIGSRNDTDWFLHGRIDEVAVYSQPLSAGRVLAHYNAGQSQFASVPYAPTVLHDGPAGYWRLGEASSTTAAADVSGNNNPGTYTGSLSVGQPGALPAEGDTAVSFAGGYTQIGNPTSLQLYSQITLEAWVKTTQAADSSNKPILTRWNSSTSAQSWYFGKVGANIALYPALSTTSSVSAAFTLINDGNWHQVVGVADSSHNLYLYVDGVLQGTSTWTTTQTGAADWRIGGNQDVSGEVWNGSIDEAAIYSTPLSATQIMTHYKAGVGYGIPAAPLNLTTTTVVDGQGRPTKVTDPNGNITYTVYNDAAREVRVYPGWNSSTHTTTGPIQVTREYWPLPGAPSGQQTVYDETLTSSATPTVDGSGVPTGQETIDQTNIQSLTRTLTDNSGRVNKIDTYFSLANVTYSQAIAQLTPTGITAASSNDSTVGNYSETLYGYDSRGRQNFILEPTGTRMHTVYDALGRVIATFMGTTDTHSGTDWTPATNTGNMIAVQEDRYDTQSAPNIPSFNTATSGGSLPAGTYYVEITYIINGVETAPSLESSVSVGGTGSGEFTVHPPGSPPAGATGYNVYASNASGQETLQYSGIGVSTAQTVTSLTTGALPPLSGVGDSNLTEVINHVGGGAADRIALMFYDWRNRPVITKQGAAAMEDSTTHRPVVVTQYDNLGEVVETDQYDGDGLQLAALGSTNGVPNTPTSSLLVSKSTTTYDRQGRPFQHQTYYVDQGETGGTIGTVGPALNTNTYYDHRGNQISVASPGGLVAKSLIDGAGRTTATYSTDGGTINAPAIALTWGAADTVVNDLVVSEGDSTLDNNGNQILLTDRERYDNAAEAATGVLGTPSSGVNARVSYVAYYYDSANRPTTTLDVGTNGGSAYTRPSAGSLPSRSDTVLRTDIAYAADNVQTVAISGSPTGGTFTLSFGGHTTGNLAYNASAATVLTALAGLTSIGSGNVAVTGGSGGPYTVRFIGSLGGAYQAQLTFSSSLTGGTSPVISVVTVVPGGDAGMAQSVTDPRNIVAKTDHDLMGRTVRTFAAFTDGVPSLSDDQTTAYTYDGSGDVLTMTAVMPAGTNSQTTAYLYGVGATSGTDLFSNDLIAKTEYPDPSTGAASTSSANDTTVTYDWQGEKHTTTDQNGTTHTLTLDPLGRETFDVAYPIGSGVDTTIKSLGYVYDRGGGLSTATSYFDTSHTSVANQVEYLYNGFGQEDTEFQAHSGLVTSTTASVKYLYDQAGGGVNDSRPRSITYPNGRVVDYSYGSSQAPITSASWSSSTGTGLVTVNTASAPGLAAGNRVVVQGVSPAGYDGTFTVVGVSGNSFTYALVTNPGTASVSDATAAKFSLDNAISRVTSLQDHAAVWGLDSAGQVLESYSYLGLGMIVQRSRPQSNISLTYTASDSNATSNPSNNGGDRYTGLDRFGRIVDQNWYNSSTSSSTDRFQYGYDRNSNVLYANNIPAPTFSALYHANSGSNGDNNTAYDPLNRLQAFRRGTLSVSSAHNNGTTGLDTVLTPNSAAQSSESWAYDAVGNQTQVTTDGTAANNTVNSRNQLTAVGSNGNSFDNNGATTFDGSDGQAGTLTLTYDAWGRLASANCNGSYAYDALGRRIIDTIAAALVKQHDLYYSNHWQVLQDDAAWCSWDPGGCGCVCTPHTDSQQYVWGQGYVDDLVLRDRQVDSTTNTRRYVQQDANYNVTAITDASGTVQERFVYDPYGREMTYSVSWAAAASKNLTPSTSSPDTDTDAWIYGFQGGRFDIGTGLYSFRNRDYSVNLMRWIEPDPAGYGDGFNLYQSFSSSPTERTDPYGLSASSNVGGDSTSDKELGIKLKSLLDQGIDRGVQRGLDTLIANLTKAAKLSNPAAARQIPEAIAAIQAARPAIVNYFKDSLEYKNLQSIIRVLQLDENAAIRAIQSIFSGQQSKSNAHLQSASVGLTDNDSFFQNVFADFDLHGGCHVSVGAKKSSEFKSELHTSNDLLLFGAVSAPIFEEMPDKHPVLTATFGGYYDTVNSNVYPSLKLDADLSRFLPPGWNLHGSVGDTFVRDKNVIEARIEATYRF